MDKQDENIHPDAVVVETAARVAYGAIAFGVTYVFGGWIGLHGDAVKEVACLNGGVAFYTHEAAGRVVAALNRVYTVVTTRQGEKVVVVAKDDDELSDKAQDVVSA